MFDRSLTAKQFPLLAILGLSTLLHAAGGSAIITLQMPVGARQLGMGEVGVALGDDPNTLYYNPAGLAFTPLASEWNLTLPASQPGSQPTTFTGRERQGFLSRPEVWAGGPGGLQHFDGREWRSFLPVVLEGEAKVRDIVRRFVGSEQKLDTLVKQVKDFNGVKTAEDESFLVEVRLPFSLVITDTVTSVFYESRTSKLWVGTTHGLFRFDGEGWKDYRVELGDVRVTAMTSQGATLWIGTNNGLYSYRNGALEQKGKVLPSQKVCGLAWSEFRRELYVALEGAGIARMIPRKEDSGKDRWNLYTTVDGLLDSLPLAVVADSAGHIWVAHAEGLSHFNLRKWEQVRFENNRVNSLSVASDWSIWIATEKGLWRHLPDYATPAGRKNEKDNLGAASGGTWTHYHTGNGLVDLHAKQVFPQGDDIWLATGAGVERFRKAGSQFSFFYEKLLPVLNIPDLYHLFAGTTMPAGDWGTLGAFINFISFGETTVSGEGDANTQASFNSSELVAGLSYGTRLNRNWGLGVNFKFFYSNLSSGAATGQPDAKTASYAIDAGVLGRDIFTKGLDFGVVLANMGPNVYYLDKSNDDPIPLQWRFGSAYHLLETVDHRILLAADYNREMLMEDDKGHARPFYITAWKDWTDPAYVQTEDGTWDAMRHYIGEGTMHVGMEYTYANTVALRTGYLHDEYGQRQEVDLGLGVLISDILQIDVSNIKGVQKTEGVRDGQTRFSLLMKF